MGKFVAIILLVLALVSGAILGLNKLADGKIHRLEAELDYIKSDIPIMRFSIQDNSNDEIHLVYQFYNSMDEGLGSIRSITIDGSQLFIDFAIYRNNVSKASLVYPLTIYSNKIPPAKGISIFTEYDDKGSPGIYMEKGTSRKDKRSLEDIYTLVTESVNDKTLLDEINTNKEDLSFCSIFDVTGTDWAYTPNMTYKVLVHPSKEKSSSIEIIEEY